MGVRAHVRNYFLLPEQVHNLNGRIRFKIDQNKTQPKKNGDHSEVAAIFISEYSLTHQICIKVEIRF